MYSTEVSSVILGMDFGWALHKIVEKASVITNKILFMRVSPYYFLVEISVTIILFKIKSYICNFIYLTLVRLICQEKFLRKKML